MTAKISEVQFLHKNTMEYKKRKRVSREYQVCNKEQLSKRSKLDSVKITKLESDDENEFNPDNIPYLHAQKTLNKVDMEYCQLNGIAVNSNVVYTDKEKETIERNFRKFQQDYPAYETDWLLGFGVPATNSERKRFMAETHFYARLAHGLPSRLSYSVFHYARRNFHSQSKRMNEKYTEEEERILDQLFEKSGANDCVEIGRRLNRHPKSISHKFYNWEKRKLEQRKTVKDASKDADWTGNRDKDADAFLNCISAQLNSADKVKLCLFDQNAIDWSNVLETLYKSRCLNLWKKFRSEVSSTITFSPVDFISSIRRERRENETEVDWKSIGKDYDLADGETALLLFRCLEKYFRAVQLDDKDRPFPRTLKKLKRLFAADSNLTFRTVFDSGFV